MRKQQFQLDRAKLKEAVWFVASYCPPEELGNVKLHKILYFADMLCFLKEGRPLTGVDYMKQKFGPVARHLTYAVNELVTEQRMSVTEEDYFGLYKKVYRPIGPEQRGVLSDQEKALIREIADFVRGKSAKEISEISHNAAWEAAELGEVIPYFTALRLVPAEINDSDRQWAKESAREYAAKPQ